MNRIISKSLLFLVIFSLGIFNVSAENIDCTKSSSLQIHYQYDSLAISDANVSLYFLANMNENGEYLFRNNYSEIAFNFDNMVSTDIQLKANEIFSYIQKNELWSDYHLKTNHAGYSYFSNLIPGLYLVSVGDKTIGNYQYNASPMLITVPILEDDSYQYDVFIDIKTERKKIEQEIIPPGDTDGDINVPNTLDNIYLYVGLLAISTFVLLGVIIYILKKKGEKDENKK